MKMLNSKINVLFVDDESLVSYCINHELEKENIHTCAYAKNGKEAIKLLPKIKPDIVLLDLEMPVLNGTKTISMTIPN